MLYITIVAQSISKKFGNKTLFQNINFKAYPSHPIAITGPNGSGKSTLLEIIAGIRKPSFGNISYLNNGDATFKTNFLIGFLSPRLRFYDELTAEEIIKIIAHTKDAYRKGISLLHEFGLHAFQHMQICKFSTGMVQRLKIVSTLINDSPVLLLDEPSSNLDADGKQILFSLIKKLILQKTIIIATNESEEASFCKGRVDLGT